MVSSLIAWPCDIHVLFTMLFSDDRTVLNFFLFLASQSFQQTNKLLQRDSSFALVRSWLIDAQEVKFDLDPSFVLSLNGWAAKQECRSENRPFNQELTIQQTTSLWLFSY